MAWPLARRAAQLLPLAILFAWIGSSLPTDWAFLVNMLASGGLTAAGCFLVYQVLHSHYRQALAELESRLALRLGVQDSAGTLFSSQFFRTRLEQECKRSIRYKLSMALLIVDFKAIAGLTGEEMRIKISKAMVLAAARIVRSEDVVGYVGDLRYAFLLPHTDAAGAEVVVKRINDALREFSPKVGVATLPSDGTTGADLIAGAAADVQHRATRLARSRLWNEDEIS
jgi:GGDEF domain-containing protein